MPAPAARFAAPESAPVAVLDAVPEAALEDVSPVVPAFLPEFDVELVEFDVPFVVVPFVVVDPEVL